MFEQLPTPVALPVDEHSAAKARALVEFRLALPGGRALAAATLCAAALLPEVAGSCVAEPPPLHAGNANTANTAIF
jgi:hypothetical protein